MNTLTQIIILLIIGIMFSSITSSFIQYFRYRDKWMKYFLIDVISVAVFLIAYHYYFTEKTSDNFNYSGAEYIVIEAIAVLTLAVHCVSFPKFIIHVSELKTSKSVNAVIFTVPVLFLIFIFVFYFTVNFFPYINLLVIIDNLGEIIISAIFLLFLVFHIIGLVRWKIIENKESKKGILIYLIISIVSLLIGIFDEIVPQEWLSEEYLFFSDIHIYIFPFLIFLVILAANLKRMIYISNLKSKEDFPEEVFIEYKITEREKDIINLLVKGDTYSSISNKLFISKKTVNAHVYRIYKKLGINNKVELIGLGLKFSN